MIQTVSLAEVNSHYSSPAADRYQSLISNFTSRYGAPPDFIARAPGRVNIIGEHIDYEGYGVLPTAIDKDILIAAKRVQTDTLEVSHILKDTFPQVTLSKLPSAIWEGVKHTYTKYLAAGYRAGTFELIEESKVVGLQILIEGNVPMAAGISSSSAFCVCAALAAAHANGVKGLPTDQFVERCIKFEREVGTASGGMDQSISVLGKKDSCLYIQFNPIRAQKVPIPLQNYKLIVMNSLVDSPKLETALYRYNKRVCECRIATHLLAKNMKIPVEVYRKWTILKEVEQYSQLGPKGILALVDTHLPKKDYTREELELLLGVPLLEIVADIQRAQEVLEANKTFRIFEAAYHVFSEASRVLEFIQVCNSDKTIEDKVNQLGALMNMSQKSCKELYMCSCPQIDELTHLAIENGALGSRLTGAGWGGCTISIVPAHIEEQFIQKMKSLYYERPEVKEKLIHGVDSAIFATQPSEGAFVVDLSDSQSL